ncbi:zonular occludens toxin domain-containing protein [Xenophilus azovorans]|uniref:zonular occludens toxin domain-containing protein n=1 Tax=Xenophilus azovorans TaxID=151755 RepID=UPI00057003D4|nr:zonular occludens toxin domain-containing protein [Xenophilus azovorans]
MLYLRTGANGSCKSLFTLKDLRDKQVKEGRSVCVIIGKPATQTEPADTERRYLRIKPKTMQEFGWVECHYSEWWSQPDGTIFLADECHNWLPKRPNGSAVPEYISKLAEHRSRGFDFFLLTQHPSNLDSFVTKLIGAPGWHQHLKRVAGGSNVTSVIQWDAVNNQCEKNGAGRSGQVTMRGQPKEVYEWYDSAELHTGKTRIPRAAIFLAVSLVLIPTLLGGGGYMLWKRTVGKAPQQAQLQAPGAMPVAGQGSGGQQHAVKTTAEYIASYQPRLAGLRHSAPAYDELTKPARVPVPAACMSMGDKCKCYTQDATPYTVDAMLCKQIVASGIWLDFDPNPQRKNVMETSQPAQARPDQVAQAPSGLSVFEAPTGMLKDLGKPAIESKPAIEAGEGARPRVPKSSPWSFTTGG